MHIELLNSPQTAIAHVSLEPNEELSAQHGSLIAMSADFSVQTSARRSSDGGSRQANRALQARTMFLNSYQAGENGGHLYLAPALIGNIGHYQLGGHKLILRQSSYLASSGGIDIFMGYKSSGKSSPYSWLSLVGQGEVLMSAFGAIYSLDVDGKQIVNCDHVVAFDNSLKLKEYKGKNKGGWLNKLLPRRELLYEFKGNGTIFCQSHGPHNYALEIGKQLQPENFKLH